MRKLILRNSLAPGDIVMLTAAVRDLHRCYPNRFVTDVRTPCPALWYNNPYITALSERDPGVQVINCSYPLIDHSNTRPYHCLHGFIAYLNKRLKLKIEPTEFRGDVHLSPQEKAWYSQVHELAGIDLPFWIVAAGGKYDLTIKWWNTKRYQEVVDHFRGKIQFVQIGAPGHYHPRLEGTIDLRGKTNFRELIRLVHHSQGVLCGVTAAMHLAAAVERKYAQGGERPCVVIAGGREPAHWEAYPGHQFISVNGALSCCTNGGCWRSRTVPLGDGDHRDEPQHLCKDVVNDLPRCMDMITADTVADRIQIYFEGGVVNPLNRAERQAALRAVEASTENPYDESTLTVHNARIALERFLKRIPPAPRKFSGRGIVICGGGVRYFTNAWVCINMLRQVGCKLPIELWHLGKAEMEETMRELVRPLGVQCVDAHEAAKKFPVRKLGGWQSKAFAILFSKFREVLFLDADNVPVADPGYLFSTPQYRKTGAIFWPDYPSRSKKPEVVWKSSGLERPGATEFESGQIVVDKSRCWKAMRLALWFNEHSDFYYQFVHGDKETFHLAFHKLQQSYGFVEKSIQTLEATMCQHDFRGRRIFQHRNMDKWSLFPTNKKIEEFWFESDCRRYLNDLRERWDGMSGRYLRSKPFRARPRNTADAPHIAVCMITCPQRRKTLDRTLRSLARSDWGNRTIHLQTDEGNEESPEARQTKTALAALKAMLRVAATHILFLEDDLRFNRHLLHNLCAWSPLRRGIAVLASLYNPGVRPLACSAHENFSLCPNLAVYGSQAFLVSREAVKYIVQHWDEEEGMQDIRISRLAARLQSPMFYHTPSLVQHVGTVSTWGGHRHRARDFDLNWRS